MWSRGRVWRASRLGWVAGGLCLAHRRQLDMPRRDEAGPLPLRLFALASIPVVDSHSSTTRHPSFLPHQLTPCALLPLTTGGAR